MSAFYFFPRERERGGAVALNILIYNFCVGILAAATLANYPELLAKLFGNAELTQYGPKVGMLMLLRVFSSFLESAATARQDVKASTIFIVAAQFTKSAVMLIVVFWSATLNALLYGSMVQGVLQSAVMLWYLERCFPGFWKKGGLAAVPGTAFIRAAAGRGGDRVHPAGGVAQLFRGA